MRTLPWITVVGDTTFGALSTVIEKLAPNGWQYRNCPQVLFDTTGRLLVDSKGRYLDGVGIAPDVYVVNYLHDIRHYKDNVLLKAMKIIENSLRNSKH